MSDLKPKATKIKLGKNEYGLRFTLNAIDEIQDHFEIPIADLYKVLNEESKRIKTLKYIIALLVNEDVDCQNDEGMELKHIDERFVGRCIDINNMHEMMSTIISSFSDGTPDGDEEESPNAASEPTD